MSEVNAAQKKRMGEDGGFIAALDQSGGSTPKALAAYGVTSDAWTDETGMFDQVHAMRTRIVTSPAFDKRVVAAILFEKTMDRDFEGKPAAQWLWEVKNCVPLLKVDKGLAPEENGCQIMKPNPGLEELCKRAAAKMVFGTKMRSFIKANNEAGIKAVVAQQFEDAKRIIGEGLCPIIEPEVDINTEDKDGAEKVLCAELLAGLNALADDQIVMLKLTIPNQDNLYADLIAHKNVLRVVALSGGYPRDEANAKLAKNKGMIASFSRALTEGLTVSMSDEEYNKVLNESIQGIYDASIA
eukprot:m.19279 g.19279  ORF g.19279 m.19279 type:complete len:298 (+) comp11754_c0_seq1:94-987(+)